MAGKLAATSRKRYCFYFHFLKGWWRENRRPKTEKIYWFYLFFWRAGGGKNGGQKPKSNISLFVSKLIFFAGWWQWRENWLSKTEKIYVFYFLNLIFFGWLENRWRTAAQNTRAFLKIGRAKICGKKNGKIIQALFFVKISIFWRAGRRKLGDIVKLLRAYFAEIAPEKACKKTCQQYCSYFLHIHMWAWSWAQKTNSSKAHENLSYFVHVFSLSWPWKHPKVKRVLKLKF